MNKPKSLTHFFEHSSQTALDTCAQEKIHLIDSVQAPASLLAVDPMTQEIIAHSANIGGFLNHSGGPLLGRTLADVNQTLATEIGELVKQDQVLHDVLEFAPLRDGEEYDAITHVHNGVRIVEFLPNNSLSLRSARHKMRLCSKSCAQILQVADFGKALQVAVDAAREITGFARIKVYRFLPDWSGEVLAESRVDTVPAYLGLHFPASDIPQQVRQIMTMVPCRAIGNVTDDVSVISYKKDDPRQLDLTWSVSRSVSKMHTMYLRNMGIKAAFSCSLMNRGKLWGMIAAHHTEAGMLPFDEWGLIQELGNALMLRHDQEERNNSSVKIKQLRAIESRFAAVLRQNGDVEQIIEMLIPILQEFLGADGFAFQYGAKLYTSGKTPPRHFIPKLIEWAMLRRETSDQFQTIHLHKEWAPAAEHVETACGVLIQPIVVHRVCQLIWFRGPILRRVHWAGKPDEKLRQTKEGGQILEPRASFDQWVQEHRDQSAPWHVSELESARDIFTEFLDILAAQLLLNEENVTLRKFAESAAHDLKAPLRGISMALEIMREEDFDETVVKETHAVADRSARRLTDLTNGLMELAIIREQTHDFKPTDFASVMEGVSNMLHAQITEAKAALIIKDLPVLVANERMMLRLFLNLIGNAIKYRDLQKPLEIEVSILQETDDLVELAVSDNGIGVPEEYAQRIFQPMQRLHSQDEIEGSGLGLTICDRIVAIHKGNISLDTSYQNGARFVVQLRKQMNVNDAAGPVQ